MEWLNETLHTIHTQHTRSSPNQSPALQEFSSTPSSISSQNIPLIADMHDGWDNVLSVVMI